MELGVGEADSDCVTAEEPIEILHLLCLGHCSIPVKGHHDQSHSYKRKHSTGWLIVSEV